MQKRSENCRDEKGKWACGSGTVEFGEKLNETLDREMKEEYDLEPLSYDLLGYIDVIRDDIIHTSHWLAICFKVLVKRGEEKVVETDKIDELKWFKVNNFPENLHSHLGKLLEMYKNSF